MSKPKRAPHLPVGQQPSKRGYSVPRPKWDTSPRRIDPAETGRVVGGLYRP